MRGEWAIRRAKYEKLASDIRNSLQPLLLGVDELEKWLPRYPHRDTFQDMRDAIECIRVKVYELVSDLE